MSDRRTLSRFAWLSIAVAILTMVIKAGAFFVSQSVGLLSDALESGVNLVAGFSALTALRIASRPPDDEHRYGHDKVEYLSSGAEGGLILLAAVSIAVAAFRRLIYQQPIHDLGLGIALSFIASLLNLIVARVLIRIGREHRSIALEADGKHLMTDVWTSAAVLMGLGAVSLTGWQFLDPFIALAVAVHIARAGIQLIQRSAMGLIDTSLPEESMTTIKQILERYAEQGVHYHALRTRQSGARSFVSVHVQVPGEWSVQRGHDLLESLEENIRGTLPGVTVFTHIEPIEDPRSFGDEGLNV
jgi:cation diffusion facilitator family transporter